MRRFALVGAAALCVAGLAGGGQASAHRGHSVTATNFKFSPKSITISAGSKVTWHAVKGDHTVTLKGGGLDSEISASGDSTVAHKFTRPGTYKYFCRFHKKKGMKGKVVVK